MMLMRCCPCMRPPPHPMDDADDSDFEDDDEDDEEDAPLKQVEMTVTSPRAAAVAGRRESSSGGGWREVPDGEGNSYWWNEASGETSWDDPTGPKQRGRHGTQVSMV